MRNVSARYVLWGQLFLAVGVGALAGEVAAQVVPVSCQNSGPGLSAPCLSLRTRNVLLSPTGENFALLLNFGLAWPGAGGSKFELLCEEAYTSKSPDHALLLDSGAILIPTLNGLRRTTLGDGCAFSYVEGIPRIAIVVQIVAERKSPNRIWALTTSAEPRRSIYLSQDGGLNFSLVHTFAPGVVFWNLAVSDSDPVRVLVSGSGAVGPLALATSMDGGQTFALVDPLPAFADALQGATMLGISPDDPDTVFFSRATPTGPEELWRSRDGGLTAQKLLALEEGEIVSGFTFGASAQALFVAGYRLLQTEGVPPAHLFVSKDGGDSWRPPIASSTAGPRLRCLQYRRGTLWGCGGEASEGDAFLLGRSMDEGLTWAPVADVSKLSPLKACVASLCPATEDWLCSSYGLCAAKPSPPPKSGSGCSVQRHRRSHTAAIVIVLFALPIWFVRRRLR
jgi:hypothetical protein